ncbi:unnamed protein product [Rangifer tarandus platyrhynchus]|uniref:Uncharacterized protein n=1 Tax=Rangifer tarandus platyrhynchus TaxID=3082113 RepID=A0ABN8XXD0_RANTA|nr:unnamed protein product [Rangifer tarandus platyrhynchus]
MQSLTDGGQKVTLKNLQICPIWPEEMKAFWQLWWCGQGEGRGKPLTLHQPGKFLLALLFILRFTIGACLQEILHVFRKNEGRRLEIHCNIRVIEEEAGVFFTQKKKFLISSTWLLDSGITHTHNLGGLSSQEKPYIKPSS